ncbi:MAG: aldo/keto reductase [Chthoniobacterales bacterium]
MIYRRFGRSEIQIPVFSCGGMRYQHTWKREDNFKNIPKENQHNLEKIIHHAFENGINHIETARGYGTSELQLGKILPKLPREKLIIQTKIAPEENPADFLKNFEDSLAKLQLDYVDLLALHGINTPELLDLVIRPGGCMEIAQQLRREGRIRHIGFSTHAPLAVIQQAIRTGEFDYVNLHWYWINQSNRPAIDDAVAQDMGIFIISPSDKGGKLYAPPEKLKSLCSPLSPIIFNDLFCLLHPEIHTLSIGAARPEDFDEHLQAAELLTDQKTARQTVEKIILRLENALRERLGNEWYEHWQDEIPDAAQLPGEINVWEILRLLNFAKGLDMLEFGKMRYNLLGNGGHWFPGKNAANFDEPALLKALKNSPFKERIPGLLREAHNLLFEAQKKRLSESRE